MSRSRSPDKERREPTEVKLPKQMLSCPKHVAMIACLWLKCSEQLSITCWQSVTFRYFPNNFETTALTFWNLASPTPQAPCAKGLSPPSYSPEPIRWHQRGMSGKGARKGHVSLHVDAGKSSSKARVRLGGNSPAGRGCCIGRLAGSSSCCQGPRHGS